MELNIQLKACAADRQSFNRKESLVIDCSDANCAFLNAVQITLAVMSADCVFTPSVADDEKFSFYFFCHFKTP